MVDWVVDSSAVLAFVLDEPGGAAMEDRFSRSMISAVNLAEVIGKMVDRDISRDREREAIERLGLDVVPVDEDLAAMAGELRRQTNRTGISLGDRICLMLARREGLPVLTADRHWAKLDIGIDVRLIR